MKTIEEIRAWGIAESLKELEKIKNVLNRFENGLTDPEIGIPEFSGIAIKTVFLFLESEHGFQAWLKNIQKALVLQMQENKTQTRH